MRAWPVSEGCFARDSSRRMRSAGRHSAAAAAPNPTQSTVSCILTLLFTTEGLQSHDGPRRAVAPPRAGRHQLPADQPHSPPAADPLHGLVQQDRAAAGARAFDRDLAALRRLAARGGEERALFQPARLL